MTHSAHKDCGFCPYHKGVRLHLMKMEFTLETSLIRYTVFANCKHAFRHILTIIM